MVLNQAETKELQVLLNTTDKQDAVIRLIATSLMEGSNISAGEMNRTLQIAKTIITAESDKESKKYINQAV